MSSRMFPAVVLFVGSMLGGCEASKDKPATQVAAKVNKEEISVHQVNFALQRTPGVTTETADAAGRRILDRLVDQELAIQKARELKLDRNPVTVQALEAARREVLARAYIESLIEGIQQPTEAEVAAYYAQKPALFKDRKIYTIQEVNIAGTPQQVAQVQATLAAAKSTQDFAEYLKRSGLKFAAKLTTQPAENLPLDLVDRLATLRPGQALFLPQPGGAKALILASAIPEPVDAATAAPVIEKFLMNDRKRARTESEIQALRAAAKVERVGKFAEAGVAAPPVSTAADLPRSTPAASASAVPADIVREGMSGSLR